MVTHNIGVPLESERGRGVRVHEGLVAGGHKEREHQGDRFMGYSKYSCIPAQ